MFDLTRFDSLPAAMLLSVVNTQLRDHFSSLDALADYHDISASALCAYLEAGGFCYVAAQNQFKAK